MAKRAAGGGKRRGASAKRAAGISKRRERSAPPAAPIESGQTTWIPSRFALWSQRWSDPNDANPTSVLLHHPTAPFVRIVDQINDATMRQIGFEYLTQRS